VNIGEAGRVAVASQESEFERLKKKTPRRYIHGRGVIFGFHEAHEKNIASNFLRNP
jgi:hypothetical protein